MRKKILLYAAPLMLLLATKAFALDVIQGKIVSTGASVNNLTTTTPFQVPTGTAAIQCDADAYVEVGASSSAVTTANTGVKVPKDAFYEVTTTSSARVIAVLGVSGNVTCKVFNVVAAASKGRRYFYAMGGAGGGGGTPDPTRADVAVSYDATTTTAPALLTSPLECAININRDAPGYCLGVDSEGYMVVGDSANPTDVRVPGILFANGTTVNGALEFAGTEHSVDIRNVEVGTPVRVVDVDGLQINNTSPLKGVLLASVSYDFGTISAGGCNGESLTVTGAVPNDFIIAQVDCDFPPGIFVDGSRVTAPSTVTLRLCNLTAADENPLSCTYRFLAMR